MSQNVPFRKFNYYDVVTSETTPAKQGNVSCDAKIYCYRARLAAIKYCTKPKRYPFLMNWRGYTLRCQVSQVASYINSSPSSLSFRKYSVSFFFRPARLAFIFPGVCAAKVPDVLSFAERLAADWRNILPCAPLMRQHFSPVWSMMWCSCNKLCRNTFPLIYHWLILRAADPHRATWCLF